jgi:hypothetical protein
VKTGFVNAILGARIRRILNRKGLIEGIAALVNALHHIDDYALPSSQGACAAA